MEKLQDLEFLWRRIPHVAKLGRHQAVMYQDMDRNLLQHSWIDLHELHLCVFFVVPGKLGSGQLGPGPNLPNNVFCLEPFFLYLFVWLLNFLFVCLFLAFDSICARLRKELLSELIKGGDLRRYSSQSKNQGWHN